MNMMPKAPLDILSPEQIADIQKSEGPHTVYEDCYRIKQYVKSSEITPGCNPSLLPFAQPYQVASAWTGSTWSMTNRTFMGQISVCNLDCPYCYCGNADRRLVGSDEYVLAWDTFNKTHPELYTPILRISGGEPMLYQGWVEKVIRCSRKLDSDGNENDEYLGVREPYIWVDTNGTLFQKTTLLSELSCDGVGVNVCFKYRENLSTQLGVCEDLISNGVDTYFYIPAWYPDHEIECFASWVVNIGKGLEAISPYAPLRVTIIKIKEYEANKARGFTFYDSEYVYQVVKEAWYNEMRRRYPSEMLWLPSNQVPL